MFPFRFYSHDLMHKVLYLICTCGVFIQVLNINSNFEIATVSHDAPYISSSNHSEVTTSHYHYRLLAASASSGMIFIDYCYELDCMILL